MSSRERYARHLVIQDKHEQLIPFVPNRAQRHFRQQRTGRDLILKSRQMGLSTEIQADNFLEAITHRVRSATLAHDDSGTAFLRRMADRFWTGLPDGLRPTRGLDNATTTTYPDSGSEVFIATAGSKNKGRAGTYTRVHGSEVAFWPDAGATMAGLMQGVPAEGVVTLESTANGAQGWFYERCMEALDGSTDWTLHFYPWWWDEGYRLPVIEPLTFSAEEQRLIDAHALDAGQIAWRRAKQRELGRLFLQEYPEDPRTCFLTSGGGYFADIPDFDGLFSAPTAAEPQIGHLYVAGLDFAQTSDYTVLSVLDSATLQEVDLLRMNRLSWTEMRSRIADTCLKWQLQLLVPERNSMGSTNIEELLKEFDLRGIQSGMAPFDTTAQTKPPLIQGLHWALAEGGLKLLPDSAGRQELNTFVASQTPSGAWKYEAANGGHDDTVIARALAWHGARRSGPIILFEG